MRPQIDVVDDSMDFLICQKALIQALIQKVVVQNYYFVDGFDLLQVFFELVEVGLQHFEEHVVEVILTKLQHLVPRPVSLREHGLDIAFFCRLVNTPSLLQTGLDILLEEQMPEYELILVYGFFRDNQTERPLHLVLQSE